MDLYLKVRHAHFEEGLSGRQIARDFGISRDSVSKMLAYSEPPGYRRTAPIMRPKLDAFTGQIDQWLAEDKVRPRKQRHTAKRIFERLRDECGFDGGYTIVKDYVRSKKRGSREMFVPLKHDVVVFAADDKGCSAKQKLDDSVKLISTPESETPAADQLLSLQIASENIDALVLLSDHSDALRYAKCAHRLGLPLVISEQSLPSDGFQAAGDRDDSREIILNTATLIHTPSVSIMRSIPSYLSPLVRVVPNTIPYEPSSRPISDPNAVMFLLCDFEHAKESAIEPAIAAFAHLVREFSNLNISLMCGGKNLQLAKKCISKNGLEDTIDFEKSRAKVYKQADVFLTVSDRGGYSTSLCEAQAHGVPSVAVFPRGSGGDQIIQGKSGILVQGSFSTKSLAQEIRSLLCDDERRQKMGKKARSVFRKKFSKSAVIPMWEKIFAEAYEVGPKARKPNAEQIALVRLNDAMTFKANSLDATNSRGTT